MTLTQHRNALTAVLPPPFDWVEIPGGAVTLTMRGGYLAQATTVDVAPFIIAKYPVTNAQYQVFIDAEDGYANPQWWDYSRDARDWRTENQEVTVLPFGGDDAPRTHVTWYEAVAFCRWLSARSELALRLPSEAEWQRAAQGDDGRAYPWGNEWDADRCRNNANAQSIGTGPVQTHEGMGDSPFGVVDMVGNVWEWTTTNWSTGENDLYGDGVRVLRGGSWFDNVISAFAVTARSSWNPELPSDTRGFRLVLA
ncbi:MAG: formylglycine-generating enzyme family protein [Anaerolineae bacterium]|nr:formylglycine-generating enzyme family protein [Anaerolineae bacterium]